MGRDPGPDGRGPPRLVALLRVEPSGRPAARRAGASRLPARVEGGGRRSRHEGNSPHTRPRGGGSSLPASWCSRSASKPGRWSCLPTILTSSEMPCKREAPTEANEFADEEPRRSDIFITRGSRQGAYRNVTPDPGLTPRAMHVSPLRGLCPVLSIVDWRRECLYQGPSDYQVVGL